MLAPRSRIIALWLAAAVVLIAGGIRFYHVGRDGFVFDEWFTADVITGDRSPVEVVRFAAGHDAHPPLYYLLTWGWAQIVGIGGAEGYVPGIEWLLRVPSVVFGLAAIAAMMAIGSAWFSPRAGLIAGLLAALNTLWILRDVEARMYPLFVLLSLCGFALLARAIRTNRIGDWLLYAAAAAALLYTQYLAFFVLAGHVFYAAAQLRKTGWKPLWALLGGVAFVPWLPVLIGSLGDGRANIAIREPLLVVARNAFVWLINPYDFSLLPRLVTYLAWACIVWGLVLALRKREWRLFVVGTLLLPLALWWLVSLLAINVTGSRYLIIFLPWLFLLFGLGSDDLLRRVGALGIVVPAAVTLVAALGVTQLLTVTGGTDWRVLRERGLVSLDSDDAVISNTLIQSTLAEYYLVARADAPPPVFVVDDPRDLPFDLLAERDTIWYVKTVFGPWDARNWNEEEEAFFVRWSNDTTTLENVYLVTENTAIAELRPIPTIGSSR